MTDFKFQAVLGNLGIALFRYQKLLQEAEDEYTLRFGDNPSNRDDDSWIDTFHISGSNPTTTVKDVTAWAMEAKSLKDR